ncbi:hypothetical protein PR048_013553 [Dryococelus australis]|uniref:Uncharacterized protein n=1 Tax=Dryococelus australis TaxID=614101 RepID=A0ABQ9HSI1_9NEOP|nr:hypothetical protein PR048_013553 [Dryococelus australis]
MAIGLSPDGVPQGRELLLLSEFAGWCMRVWTNDNHCLAVYEAIIEILVTATPQTAVPDQEDIQDNTEATTPVAPSNESGISSHEIDGSALRCLFPPAKPDVSTLTRDALSLSHNTNTSTAKTTDPTRPACSSIAPRVVSHTSEDITNGKPPGMPVGRISPQVGSHQLVEHHGMIGTATGECISPRQPDCRVSF